MLALCMSYFLLLRKDAILREISADFVLKLLEAYPRSVPTDFTKMLSLDAASLFTNVPVNEVLIIHKKHYRTTSNLKRRPIVTFVYSHSASLHPHIKSIDFNNH